MVSTQSANQSFSQSVNQQTNQSITLSNSINNQYISAIYIHLLSFFFLNQWFLSSSLCKFYFLDDFNQTKVCSDITFFQSFVPEFIQLLSGKNTAELAVIAENLRVFRILRSLKMVSYLLVFCSWVNNFLVKVIPLNLKRMYYPDFFKLGAKHWKNTMKDPGVTGLNLAWLAHYPECVLRWGKKGRSCNDVCLIFIFTPETLTA